MPPAVSQRAMTPQSPDVTKRPHGGARSGLAPTMARKSQLESGPSSELRGVSQPVCPKPPTLPTADGQHRPQHREGVAGDPTELSGPGSRSG